jgi:allantoicase
MASFTDLLDLASERLGGAVIYANDDFFAEKENLLKPKPAVFLEHEYTDRGKWMDGWESRRKRGPGHDFCLVRLGAPGIIRGVVVDTAFFRGNYPDHCSIEACCARPDAAAEELLSPSTKWEEILDKSPLAGDSKNLFAVTSVHHYTHLRFNIFPDGGVARLRVHGDVVPDIRRLGSKGVAHEIDLAAAENGARVLACSDMFFGNRHNLTMPGRAANMGDGWETKRRRGEGHDWSLIELTGEGTLSRIEVDTNHFKGNYPDTAMIEGCRLAPGVDASADDVKWREIVARTKLQAHTRHHFEDELRDRGPFTHVRLNIYPDGGVSRLRIFGALTSAGLIDARVSRLNTSTGVEAMKALRACCGSSAWAAQMLVERPFSAMDRILTAADEIWASLEREDWLEAFRAHPRIGETRAEKEQSALSRRWAQEEQAASGPPSGQMAAALAAANRAYDDKFGHIFIVCATGKTPGEMLAILDERLGNDAAEELAIAAEEQRKITRLRLEKLFTT